MGRGRLAGLQGRGLLQEDQGFWSDRPRLGFPAGYPEPGTWLASGFICIMDIVITTSQGSVGDL